MYAVLEALTMVETKRFPCQKKENPSTTFLESCLAALPAHQDIGTGLLL